MKIFRILVITLLLSSNVFAQETVQWASEVMFVTSELTALQYAASQALHSPNVYPSGGESPNAWRPGKTDKQEYIVVKFDKPIRAQQIAIAETENPGAVSKVYAYDSLDNEYLLFDLNTRPIPLKSRLLNLFFEKTPYRIAYLRVDINGESVPGYNSIDAIGLSSSNIPISVLIELASNVNNNLSTTQLGTNVNSEYSELGPLLSPDGKKLYFSRMSHPDNVGGTDDYSDIWYSELDEDTQEWLPAKNIGSPLNTPGPNYICSITQIGDEIILLLGNRYEKRGRMGEGISMSKSNGNGKWDKPVNVDIENPYNYSEQADFYMSQDTEMLIMSLERDDTNGGRDLYVSFKTDVENTWSEPMNLGSVINSADVEHAPFLDKDNKTLYFSSKGFRGYGESDIFVSKRLDDSWTKWSKPENMGSGVNGPMDDTYFNIPSTGSHAYFSRGSSDENTDVYQFRIDELFVEPVQDEPVEELIADNTPAEEALAAEEEPVAAATPAPVVAAAAAPVAPITDVIVTIKGQVFNTDGNKPISSKVIVERLPDGVKVGETYTDENGIFEFKVRSGARYGFLADKDGFLAKSENIDLNDVTENETIIQDLTLNPLQTGAAVVLNNIFFDFDQDELKTASYSELNRVLDLLNKNVINKIEISGHTDSIGDDEYNQQLSKRRANSVYQYFKSQNIDPSRMITVGYGETKPKSSNDSLENRRKNRRVEFKILE
ncbi:OmpA family protein [Reichenbachiella agariperforans]|uniref:OmpA family protein n=1 Tax=Reichenbachiella agariperforans TaxID=156994 RepID=UPI001C0A1024|nr:OmpA family protein [Reichenbachiella agariperforans]MBU2914667.1 OmpA family protein [Reichenbachiella agariperforans]